ncbi:lysis system i-spanin subunit Rz [Pseudomonas sp. 7-41]|uniref:lysis system i-spanin subunit Rz n=1 Tax=Pseudomonas sp. 7-41 TaxID=2898483 RepID=UPI001E4EBA94|nr:lysis system i-spanin subunit Rz [Pseudomonas sp. 7-41]UHG99190.1 lysis protein [Pseudomonas sp. 7-41]
MNRYLIIALAACLVLIYGGWSHIKGQAKDMAVAKDRIVTLEASAAAYEKALKVRDSIDTQYLEAISNAEKSKPQLVADLDSGVKRVYVRAACVPANPKPAGITDAATPELAADARQDYADLTAAFKKVTAQVAGLQQHILTACKGGTNQKGQ